MLTTAAQGSPYAGKGLPVPPFQTAHTQHPRLYESTVALSVDVVYCIVGTVQFKLVSDFPCNFFL